MIQATEAIKLILGEGEPLLGRLLLYDALAMSFRELKLQKDGHCTICSEHRTIHELDRDTTSSAACLTRVKRRRPERMDRSSPRRSRPGWRIPAR
ncbi:MAG: hypothetical protein R3E12_15195 [Candidatus Eisenbacteria bacterium]